MTKSCKGLFTALFIAGALMLAAGPAASAEPVSKAEKSSAAADPAKEIVLRVDKAEISRAQYDNAIATIMPQMSMHASMSHEKINKIKTSAVNRIITAELFYVAAEKEKVQASKKDIDKEIETLKSRLNKGQTIESVLKNSNMTMAELREQFKKNIMNVELQKKKQGEFAKAATALVTGKYLKDYYNKNTEKYKLPEQIHMRAILIKADPSGGPPVWNASFKKAKEVIALARGSKKSSPRKFSDLAKKYSEHPSAKGGGDMGWVHRGEPLEEIDLAASKMKIGDISEPVTTIFGYYIIKLEGIKPAVQMKFSEIKLDELRDQLQEKERKRLAEEWLKGLRSAAKIEYVAKDVKELMSAKAPAAQTEKNDKTEAPKAAPATEKTDKSPGK